MPSCIHLAGDGQKLYFDRLYQDYVSPELQKLHREGILSYSHAIYYGIGNHVLPVGCPWWKWYDLPPEYSGEDSPETLPKTIGTGSYESFARQVQNIKEIQADVPYENLCALIEAARSL